jgi:hypothetical protein
MKNPGYFWQLVEAGHYKLDLAPEIQASLRKDGPMSIWHGTKLSWRTKRCGFRDCPTCAYHQMKKHREKVNKWLANIDSSQYRFLTLTLPGRWYEARHLGLAEQDRLVRRAFRSYRAKWKYHLDKFNGVAVYEHTSNDDTQQWHSHVHAVVKWPGKLDLAGERKRWTESVDKKMRKQLDSWTDGRFTNDSRVVDVQRITDQGIADYLTKVTNYLVKAPKSDPGEISKALYRRRLVGWYGEEYGKTLSSRKTSENSVKRK